VSAVPATAGEEGPETRWPGQSGSALQPSVFHQGRGRPADNRFERRRIQGAHDCIISRAGKKATPSHASVLRLYTAATVNTDLTVILKGSIIEYGHLVVELDGALVRTGIEGVARQSRMLRSRGLRSQVNTPDSGPVSHALSSATHRRRQPVFDTVHLLRFSAQALLTLRVRAAHSVAVRQQMRFVWLSLAKSSRM